MRTVVIKPRCGFCLTDKSPKTPPITGDHKGSIVVYDIDEFLHLSEEDLYNYLEELIDHLRLGWDSKDLTMAITMYIGYKEFSNRTGISEKLVEEKLANALTGIV